MSTVTVPTPPRKYANAAEWWHDLGDVPLDRIIFDPWPGTATEQDLIVFVERDKRLCELVDGTLVEKPMGYEESLIAGWIITYLNMFVLPRDLGYVSGEAGIMRLLPGRVRLPDVAFVSFDDLPNRTLPVGPVPTLSPSLAVEVLSVSNTKPEIRQKMKEYFESGTRLVWIVDPPTRTVAVFATFTDEPDQILNESDTLSGGTVLPGFTLLVKDIFSRLPSRKV